MSIERLAFNHRGGAPPALEAPRPGPTPRDSADGEGLPHSNGEPRERRDWAFIGLLTFTAVLYFRPQDQVPGLKLVPFADIAALFGLGALLVGRLSRGLPVTRVTPELIAISVLGGLMLLTAPFSVWPGGAVRTFTDVFVKVILIYVLMINTLTTPDRLHRFTWVMVLTTGYIATRAVFDYARGFNLIENGRVQGAVGGMFQNPNDLALNMVAVLPLAALVASRARTTGGRLFAGFLGLAMAGAVMSSHSRGGFLGLGVMAVVFAVQLARRQPRMLAAGAMLLLFVMPFAPASYWDRILSITDDNLDETGSREARRILLIEAWQTYLTFPISGVGAGQFPAYNPPNRVEFWRETHNAVLQVAAELGTAGLAVFLYLLWRGFTAGRTTKRLLRLANGPPPSRWQAAGGAAASRARVHRLAPDLEAHLLAHAATMTAAMAGWLVCAMFASVAYSWTFYYLLALAVAPHQVLRDRLRLQRAAGPSPVPRPVEAGV